MVKFIVTKDGFYPDDIEYLKDNCTIDREEDIDGKTITVFATDESLVNELMHLERAGIVKVLHETPINKVDGLTKLLSMIDRVEMRGRDPAFFYIYLSIDDHRIDTDNNSSDVNANIDANDGNNKAVLRFTNSEIFLMKYWREKLLDYRLVLSKKKDDVFDDFIANILDKADVTYRDEETEDEMLANIVINEVHRLIKAENRDDFLENPRAYLVEENSLLVKTSTIREILSQNHITITLRRLREILRPYLSRSTKQIRIGDKLVSIWFFKNEKVNEIEGIGSHLF